MKGLVFLLALWILFLSVQTCLCDDQAVQDTEADDSTVSVVLDATLESEPAFDHCCGLCCIDYVLGQNENFFLVLSDSRPFPDALLPPPAGPLRDIFTPPRLLG